MFQTIKNAWKIPDLRKKILFTLLMLVIFRFGSFIPVPFLSTEAISAFMSSMGEDSLLNLMNMFSGGAFSQATIFAMSISPYINASIIMQLLTVAIPALERISKEGVEGRKKIAQWSRYLTVVLALVQAWGLYMALNKDLLNTPEGIPSWLIMVTIILTFTAGTAFLMWLGEQINEKGIGNGISMLIFAGIVSRGPELVRTIMSYMQSGNLHWIGVIVLVVVAILVIGFVVFMNNSERRIPVQYSKRVVGRKMYGGQSTHIPIKVAAAGVMPIIFAMSIMAFPATIAGFFGKTAANTTGFWGGVLNFMSSDHWFYAILYFLLIIFFTYFYTAIQYNPIEMANNMKKNGGFIPGIRPGKTTSDYISKSMTKITLAGAIFLGIIAVLPILMSQFAGINISIGGTSLLIMVGVALETVKQMESQMVMRHYKGFLE